MARPTPWLWRVKNVTDNFFYEQQTCTAFTSSHSSPFPADLDGADARRSGALRARADRRGGVNALGSSRDSLRARSACDARRGNIRSGRRGLRARALVSRCDASREHGCFCKIKSQSRHIHE